MTTENNNQIQKVFNYGDSKVRTVIIKGEPWFVAKDVCLILGITGNHVNMHVRKFPDEMKGSNPIATPGGIQKMSCVNEPGLYRLIMRSDKPEAQEFQNWIAKEVLPSIRKSGMYMTKEVAQEAIEDTELFLSRALLIAKEKLDRQEAELEEARPKVNYFNSYMDSTQTHCFADIASILGVHVKVLTAQLEADGILTRNIKRELKPRKAYLNTGYFLVKQTPKYIHTRVTPKGTEWLLSKYTNVPFKN